LETLGMFDTIFYSNQRVSQCILVVLDVVYHIVHILQRV